MSKVSEKRLENAYDLLDPREVTSGFGVLGLLFVEVSGEGDDLGVDLLIANRAALSISRHDCGCVKSLDVVKAGGTFW